MGWAHEQVVQDAKLGKLKNYPDVPNVDFGLTVPTRAAPTGASHHRGGQSGVNVKDVRPRVSVRRWKPSEARALRRDHDEPHPSASHELASYLRIEERELEAGGLNQDEAPLCCQGCGIIPLLESGAQRLRVQQGPMMMIRLYARLIRRLGHHRWFSLLVKHALSKLDRSLIRASRGRFSLSGREMATMLLTTKGRRSGKERTTSVYYVRDGPNLVAAYENFGLEVASEQPKSLLANAYARIQIGATVSEYRARLATDAEIARSMPRLVEMWPAHDTYLERTGTRYVFVFQPVGASA